MPDFATQITRQLIELIHYKLFVLFFAFDATDLLAFELIKRFQIYHNLSDTPPYSFEIFLSFLRRPRTRTHYPGLSGIYICHESDQVVYLCIANDVTQNTRGLLDVGCIAFRFDVIFLNSLISYYSIQFGHGINKINLLLAIITLFEKVKKQYNKNTAIL